MIFLCVFSPQRLNSAIIYDRDFSYNYFGFKVKNVALDTENCSFAIFLGLSLLGRLVILQNHLDLGKGHWSRCDVSGFVRSEEDLQKAVAQLDESCAMFWCRCLPWLLRYRKHGALSPAGRTGRCWELPASCPFLEGITWFVITQKRHFCFSPPFLYLDIQLLTPPPVMVAVVCSAQAPKASALAVDSSCL